ncbi:MAG: PGPGW domain-containing protein [Candidatus Planktophila sp.]
MNKEKLHDSWKHLPHPIRWVIVATIGGTLVVLGLIFMVLPGPGLPLVIAGLAILASEFAWAQYMLNQIRERSQAVAQKTKERLRRKKQRG